MSDFDYKEDDSNDPEESLEEFFEHVCWVCGEEISETHDFLHLSSYSIRSADHKAMMSELREEFPICLHTHCVFNFMQAKILEIGDNLRNGK